MKEKTVFFDLDDTLYDRSGPYLAAFRQFFGGRYEDKAAQAYQAVMHRGYEVFTAAHTGKISMDAMHIYRHQIGLLDVGIRITAAQALQLQALYAAQQQRITLSAAVRAALDYSREAYRAVGVSTNGLGRGLGGAGGGPCVFVGDACSQDIAGASACGWQTIWLSRTGESPTASPTLTARSEQALLPCLQALAE